MDALHHWFSLAGQVAVVTGGTGVLGGALALPAVYGTAVAHYQIMPSWI